MKKRNAFLLAAVALIAFAACIDKDLYDPEHANEVRQAQYEKAFRQAFGEIDPNHDWGFGTSRSADLTSRAFTSSSSEAPGNFASAAQGVVAYTPTYTAAPAVPEGAESIEKPNPNNQDGDPVPVTFQGGHSYVINGDESVLSKMDNYYGIGGTGFVDIYVKEGAKLSEMLNTDNGRIRYFILPGATLTTTKASAGLYNWGTVNQNGLYQYASWNGTANVCDQVIENYGTMNCTGTIQVEGTFYSKSNPDSEISALVKGNGNVYIDGDFNAEDGFGLGGKLYVSGTMSGNININIGLDAHVGSISTTGAVVVTAGSQLVVEGDVTAPSMKLDGESGGAVEVVVKGKADISGNVDIASGTKGYFDQLSCANYTANKSDIWVGCSLKINNANGKFTLNGESNFTLAAGAYLHVAEAEFSSNTKMTMMSNAIFEVDGKLQMNNADNNEINGSGDLAIVKANTLGANYENFENTFTGNIGVDFEGWDYNSSTGLIDQNTNLKRMSGLAGATVIPGNDCNEQGYTGDNVNPTTYTVKFLEKDTEFVLKEKETAEGNVGQEVTVTPPATITNDSGTYSYDSSSPENATITLVENPTATQNVITFYYKKNTTTTTTKTVVDSYRVFAEDLGSIGDFDFNDVVFDVIWYNDNSTDVVLQAAGGTLPLYLKIPGLKDKDGKAVDMVEVHGAFGVGPKDMVNTYSRGQVPPRTFTVQGSHISPANVGILVYYNNNEESQWIRAEVGWAPGKFCLRGTNVDWPNERQQIGQKYEDFEKWVSDHNYVWWNQQLEINVKPNKK